MIFLLFPIILPISAIFPTGGNIEYSQDVSNMMATLKTNCYFDYLTFQVVSSSGTYMSAIKPNIDAALVQ